MTVRTAGRGLGVLAVLVFTLLPIWMMVSTAFNGRANAGSRTLLPEDWTFRNFVSIFTEGSFGGFLVNSLLVGVATVVVSAVLAMLAAVAVSRFRFRFRTSVLVMILIIQMVPVEALVIPLFIQAKSWGMLNSLVGLVVVYVAFSLPFAIWTLRGFVSAVPVELEEAAYLDGASWARMFRSVLLPLVAPGLVATSVFSFITAWNEFVFALTFMSDDANYTVAVGLKQFFGQHATDWGSVMAASTVITIPVLVFFVLAQKRLTDGLVAGAVKG